MKKAGAPEAAIEIARLLLEGLIAIQTGGELSVEDESTDTRSGADETTHAHSKQLPDHGLDDQMEVKERRLAPHQRKTSCKLTIAEFAQEIGARVETVQAMIQDGLVKVHQRTGKWRGGAWYVPAEEVERSRK